MSIDLVGPGGQHPGTSSNACNLLCWGETGAAVAPAQVPHTIHTGHRILLMHVLLPVPLLAAEDGLRVLRDASSQETDPSDHMREFIDYKTSMITD